ncbi:hypothetical protein IW262DRAFT_1492018 [Armillaria fumosa]|nr:hypothetical protein IW262DRAFT_1492018 [Armillaria fumosa]
MYGCLWPVSSGIAENVIKKLCYVLWDSQRINNLFHGKTYQTSSKLDITAFPAWSNWEKVKLELKSNAIGAVKMDGFKDAKRLDSNSIPSACLQLVTSTLFTIVHAVLQQFSPSKVEESKSLRDFHHVSGFKCTGSPRKTLPNEYEVSPAGASNTANEYHLTTTGSLTHNYMLGMGLSSSDQLWL